MATNSALADSAAGELGAESAYRPHLDGLRAIAVYLVVFFHAGSGWFPGGYIGVDVFFVLSGFLVTQLLLRDVARNGSIRFGRFYSRRFRRLLPAAFVALTVTAVVYAAIASPAEVSAAVGSFKAAFLYSTNWYFIHQSTGYLGADITTNPVLHFWSLAVEEQFYLLWPLALGGLFVVTRRLDQVRQTRTIRIAIAIAALASVVWALSLRTSDPNRAYYGTDTRAYELLAGAMIAFAPQLVDSARRFARSMRATTVVSVALLFVIASSWIDFDAIERGVLVTIATCALIVALEAACGGFVKRALSTSPAVFLGKISYGTYLWHWLVILVVIRTFHISTLSTIGITCLVATALASLSFQMLEHPVRVSKVLDAHRYVVIASGLTITVVSALVLIPAIEDPANATAPSPQASTTAGFTPVPANLDWQDATKGGGPFVTCLDQPVSKCTVVHGTGPSILLMGDSHAWMLIPAFTALAKTDNLTLSVSVRGGCPWQRNLYARPITVNGTPLRLQDCRAQKEDTYKRVIPELHPDIVVVVNVAHENPLEIPFLGPDQKIVRNGSAVSDNWLKTTTTQSIAELRGDGAKVMIVEPIPVAPPPFNPLTCLSKAKTLEECRYVASAKPDWLELFYRQQAKQDKDVFSADFDRLVCPFLPICDPIVNGQIVKMDGTHLTAQFAKTLAPAISDYMKSVGLIPH